MTLPNFVIIGGTKAGTSSIYRCLRQHPQISMSRPKEPKFFAYEGALPDYGGPFANEFRNSIIVARAEYEALFDGVTNERAIGEASQIYMYSPQACKLMRQTIPNAKLIALLRNPADRAFSFFNMRCRKRREVTSSFRRALKLEPRRMAANWGPSWYYRDRGYYFRQLKVYYDTFPRDQIKIFLYEDVRNDLTGVLSEIMRYLGVDEVALDTSKRYNVTHHVPRSQRMAHHLAMKDDTGLKRLARATVPGFVRGQCRRLVERWNTAEPKFPEDLRRELLAGYRDDIVALQDLIGRDLSHWME